MNTLFRLITAATTEQSSLFATASSLPKPEDPNSRQAKQSFRCQKCSFSAGEKAKRSQHVRTAHRANRDFQHSGDENANKKYKCRHCSHAASHPSSLRIHVQAVHKGVRFHCQHCSFSSEYKASVGKHVRVVHQKVEALRERASTANMEKEADENPKLTDVKRLIAASRLSYVSQVVTEQDALVAKATAKAKKVLDEAETQAEKDRARTEASLERKTSRAWESLETTLEKTSVEKARVLGLMSIPWTPYENHELLKMVEKKQPSQVLALGDTGDTDADRSEDRENMDANRSEDRENTDDSSDDSEEEEEEEAN